MPRNTKVPPALRQQWLEAHDRGSRIDDLARMAGRTARTVATHIELARREREQREVRGGLLREAALRHMEDLVNLADRLRQVEPGTQTPALREPYDMTTSLLLEALHRHLPRSPLWKAREQWVNALRARATLRSGFEAYWRQRATQALQPLLLQQPDHDWESGLWLVVERRAADLPIDDMTYQRIATATGRTLTWGSYDLVRGAPAAAMDALEAAHQDLVHRVAATADTASLRAVEERIRTARTTVEREVEQLRLRRLLPGHCGLCQQ